MTIVVGVASPDGIILGADSRMTMSDGSRHRIISDSTEKLFELAERFGVATYGAAFIGDQTINGVMDEFLAQLDEDNCGDVEAFSGRLGEYFHARWVGEYGEPDEEEKEEGWSLGFLVAGYDESGLGHIWEVGVPGPTVSLQPANTANGSFLWRGQTDVMTRLIKGVDGLELSQLVDLDKDNLGEKLGALEYVVLNPTTLQDAADMASFIVRTTVDMQRFSDGIGAHPGSIPGCGGMTQLVAVSRSGVEWVNKRWLTGTSRPGWAEGTVEGGY